MIENDEWITGTILLATSALILTPVFLLQDLRPISRELIVVLGVALPLEILGYYLFLSAIRTAPLSLTVPLLAFTPVLTILTSAILLGERVSLAGALGISLVTAGTYVLNGDLAKQDPVAPLRAVISNPGSRRMLMVAVIWSITSSVGKKGVLIYGAIPFGYLLLCGIVAAFAVASVRRLNSRQSSINLKKGMPVLFLLGGVLMAGAEISHFVSLSMAPVSYMISVKRLSLVFGVAMGWLLFREHNIKYRLVGAGIMVLGVFFLYD
jgi:drug/metabolite transporter (DMT)-like permease